MKRSITLLIVLLVLSALTGCISLGDNLGFSEKETEKILSEDVTSEMTVLPDTTAPGGIEYVLNTKSMKFHYPTCGSGKLMSEKNRGYYRGTREELIQKGYSPCGNCYP